MARTSRAQDCLGDWYDTYFVDGEHYDKVIVDHGRRSRNGKPRETPEEYIRRTEKAD